jgi:hypothetical protein
MTNGDRGADIYEALLRSIAEEYGWPGYERDEKEAAALSDAEKQAMVGIYAMEGVGKVEMFIEDGELRMSGIIFDRERVYASGDDALFVLSGYDIKVDRNGDGSVKSISSAGLVLEKK